MDSGLTQMAVAHGARQQWLVRRIGNDCKGSKSKVGYDYPTPGFLVGRVAAVAYIRGRSAENMIWPDLGKSHQS